MSIFKDLFILIFDVCEHLPYMSIPHVHAMFSKTGRGHHAPGTRVTDSCEPPNGDQEKKTQASARTVTALNHWAIIPDL